MKFSSNKSLIREIAPGQFAIGNNPFAPAFLLDANNQKASVSGIEVVLDGDLQHLFDNLDLVDAQHTADISINAADISVEITRATAAEAAIQADVSQNTTKLQSIEDGATADQTDAEIKTAYEANADTNEFSDAEQTKLQSIEDGATADQTDAEIKTAYEANADTNEFSDAEQSKLQGIEASSNNYSHPNHSGEVISTADGATVISDGVVDESNLKVSNAPTNGYVLTAQSGDAGGLTWAAPDAGGGGLSEEEAKAIAFRSSIIFG
jgi:hypothetical protein